MSPSLPANVDYGLVTGRFTLITGDSPDGDRYPDGVPAAGRVVFTARPKYLLDPTADPPATLIPRPFVITLDDEGDVVDAQGEKGVYLVATTDADLNPLDWTWGAQFFLLEDDPDMVNLIRDVSFELPVGSTVDLTSVIAIDPTTGTPIAQGPRGPVGPPGPPGPPDPLADARIDALEAVTFGVVDYGAKGDVTAQGVTGNGTDDTAAIRAALAAANTAGGGVVVFPYRPIGYRTTATITVPDSVTVDMRAPIVYDPPAGHSPALVIGSGARLNRRNHRIRVWRMVLSDWTSEADVGVIVNSHFYSAMSLDMASGFTIGAQLQGLGSGFVYNVVTLGVLGDNKIGLDLTNATPSGGVAGWCNENAFLGGSFSVATATRPTLDRWGVRIGSADGTYLNNNNNHFYKPSFELHDSGGQTGNGAEGTGRGICALVTSGQNNTVHDYRNENCNQIAIQTLGGSQGNVMLPGYHLIQCPQRADDQGTNPSSIVKQAAVLATTYADRLVGQWSNLHRKVAPYDATKFHVPGLSIGTSAAAPAEATGATAITANPTYLDVATSRHIGVFLDTSVVKRFSVVTDHVSGFGGRLHIRAYDAAGVVLTGSTPRYVQGTSNLAYTYGTTWGGSYAQTSDSTAAPSIGRWFAVAPEVAYVFVGIGGGSQSLRLRGFSIYTPDAGQCSTWLAGPSPRMTDDPANYAIAAPASGTFEVGRIAWNDTPAAGAPIGWVVTAQGPPTVWKPFGTIGP